MHLTLSDAGFDHQGHFVTWWPKLMFPASCARRFLMQVGYLIVMDGVRARGSESAIKDHDAISEMTMASLIG